MAAALTFDDLLAARLLAQQLPAHRQHLLHLLRELQARRASRNLVPSLVNGGLLTREQGHGLLGHIERYKRGRQLGAFVELLARAGVDRAAVTAHGRALGATADLDKLGRVLVQAGLVAAEVEDGLRYQARIAVERDLARQVREFRGAEAPTERLGDTAGFLQSTGLPQVSDALYRLETPVPTDEESAELIDSTIGKSDFLATNAPDFEIPHWVDCADRAVGDKKGPWVVIGKVGAGGHGIVYLVHHEDDPSTPVALKVLHASAPPAVVGRFKREMLANALVHHPNVLEVKDAGTLATGEPFLAMEFFHGRDLWHLLDARGHLPARQALVIARAVLEALGVAHAEGMVHRDIKPENILVADGGARVKLMDFGIALLQSLGEFEDRVFQTIGIQSVGTPRYMSPEQAAAEKTLGPASDLYSVGLVLYEMLAGAFPYDSDVPHGYLACHIVEQPKPLASHGPHTASLPEGVVTLVHNLLKKEPDERPKSAFEVVAAIDRLLPKILDG
jgi:hypothetical protein